MANLTGLPLIARFPSLGALPRAEIGRFPTPVEHAAAIDPAFWLKRDDRSADPLGGNKVRALEFLLGGIRAGDTVVTAGAAGSTHVLSTAVFGTRLGARVLAGRWPQEMNDAARIVAARIPREAAAAPVLPHISIAYLWAAVQRLRGARWIAAGGSTPLGTLGHVNAALELSAQIDRGELPRPNHVVVPLGSGGTAAGLALGFRIAGLDTRVIGVRVVPRVVANRRRVLRLARAAARLIERFSGERLPRVRRHDLEIVHHAYGGAYGRETPEARSANERFHAWAGARLDPTYSAKAFSVAIDRARRGPTLFWLTFDARMLQT